jgi:hypothetical protein
MKAKSKSTMKENVVLVKDVEAEEAEEVEEVEEVDQEEVVVEDVVKIMIIDKAEVKHKMFLEPKDNLKVKPLITMKVGVHKEVEEIEDHIVEQMVIKKEMFKVATKAKEEVVEEASIVKIEAQEITITKDHKMHTKDTVDKMKEVSKVEPEVVQEIKTTIKIDQEEVELKVVTLMRVEPEEETEVLDHKILMKDQPTVEQEVVIGVEMHLVEQEE